MSFICAGSFSASISEESKSMFLWGSGSFGEFLVPHRVKRIQGEVLQASIGQDFGVALCASGTLHSWGENKNGELGTADYLTRTTP